MMVSVPPPSLSSSEHGSQKRPAPEDDVDSGKASPKKCRYTSTPDSTGSRRSIQSRTSILPAKPVRLSPDIFTLAAQSFFATLASTSDQLLETFSFDDDQNEFPPDINDIEHKQILYLPIYRPSTGYWCLGVLSVSEDDACFHYYDPSNDTDRHSVMLSWAENLNSQLPHPHNETRTLKFTTLVHVGIPPQYDVLR